MERAVHAEVMEYQEGETWRRECEERFWFGMAAVFEAIGMAKAERRHYVSQMKALRSVRDDHDEVRAKAVAAKVATVQAARETEKKLWCEKDRADRLYDEVRKLKARLRIAHADIARLVGADR